MKLTLFLTFYIIVFNGNSFCQAGQFWGVTSQGGTENWGTVYKMDFDGSNRTIVHNFDYVYGGTPLGSLVLASDGNIYGSCYDGGSYASCTIYRIEPISGTFTHLWDFDITTGDFPMGGMVNYGDRVYGFGYSGGTTSTGVLYYWDYNSGSYGVAHNFNPATGHYPVDEPILVGDKLYGTTSAGGAFSAGVLFEYDLSTNTYDTLASFNNLNGAGAQGGVMMASNGNLYGMTAWGGDFSYGNIYSYDFSSGQLSLEYSFDGSQGCLPSGKLMEGTDGLLYGMTPYYDLVIGGSIFAFDPVTGTINWLHEFTGLDGLNPVGDLTQFGNTLYGAASQGGNIGYGVLFEYDLSTNTYSITNHLSGSDGSQPRNGNFILIGTDPSKTNLYESSQIKLFPTISSGNINLKDCSNYTLSVFNMNGDLVHKSFIQDNETTLQLDLSTGTYIWKLDNKMNSDNGKLIIQ